MKIVVEPATPFERAMPWRLHDAYFAQRGPAAWTKHEVPSQSTSNYASARHAARVLVALVEDLVAAGTLGPSDDVWVLEGGCGHGQFACNVLRALAKEHAASRLAERVRYVLTDYSETNLRAVVATEPVAEHVRAGRVLPALYDIRAPQRVRLLDGGALTRALTLVMSNYLCCVLPMKQLQRRSDGTWRELFVATRAEVTEPALQAPEAFVDALLRDATRANLLRDLELHFDWPVTDLARFLGDARHVAIVEAAIRGLPDATVGYPIHYFDFMLGLVPLLVPGGAVLTTDYGSCSKERLRGLFDRRPQQYGNSFAQDVNFTLFDAFAEVTGWDLLRSSDELESLHRTLAAPTPLGANVRAAFADRGVWGLADADHLLDFHAAARVFRDRKEPARALRYVLRCTELDPYATEYRHLAADLALDLGHPQLALEHLLVGFELEPLRFDWEFMLGRATCLLKQFAASAEWYEKSLRREQHPVTYTNLGSIHQHEGRLADAYRCFQQALALDPKYERAHERMKHLRETVWERAVAEFEAAEGPARG